MKKTKQVMACCLALTMLFAMAACGKTAEEPTTPTSAPTTAGTPAPTEEPPRTLTGPFSPDGSIIFEKDGVTVTTAGLDTDPTTVEDDTIIWLDIQNSGDKDVYLGVADGSVNGFMSNVTLNEYFDEETDGYFGSSSDFGVTVPAGESVRRALGCGVVNAPNIDLGAPAEIEFSFTTAEDEYTWHDFVSEPVVIQTGETAQDVDITTLGTVVIDNEKMTLVFGEQDYDDWFGPTFEMYLENKADRWIGISAEEAEGDGVVCDYMYGAIYAAPGKKCASSLSFDGELRDLKGIENLTVTYRCYEADSYDDLGSADGSYLDPVSVTYPPQVWGEYENAGLRFEVKPKINNLITVETLKNDENGVLFSVSETASLEAGGHDGAGWLFSIAKVSEDTLHEMLQNDMSGVEVFAKGEDGNYYLRFHPTDVRYERATVEEMQRDAAQWTMLNEWGENAASAFAELNGLESKSYGNTVVDMYLARAAWGEDVNATLSTTEFGPVELKGVDGTPYAEFVMEGFFDVVDLSETPDGEYVVLNFPEEDVHLDFFFAEGSYVRVTTGGAETLYQSFWWDDNISNAEAMQGWYYAVAELAGVKPFNESLVRFYGPWYEKIAGRGEVNIEWCVAPGKVKVTANWPESSDVMDTWEMIATLSEDGKLVYENGQWEQNEYDENGESWTTDSSWEESGWFELSGTELTWHNDRTGDDSTFAQ